MFNHCIFRRSFISVQIVWNLLVLPPSSFNNNIVALLVHIQEMLKCEFCSGPGECKMHRCIKGGISVLRDLSELIYPAGFSVSPVMCSLEHTS